MSKWHFSVSKFSFPHNLNCGINSGGRVDRLLRRLSLKLED